MGIVLISLMDSIFLKQSLNMPTLLGMSLIVAGVVVINLYSKSLLR